MNLFNRVGVLEFLAGVAISAAIVIIIAIVVVGPDEPKKQTVVKITQKSTIDSVEAKFDRHFKIPKGKPDVVWQHKVSGETVSESFILSGYKKSQHELIFKTLRQQNMRRVYEECKGIVRRDNNWSLGYCTYRPAPVGLKG